MGKSNNLNNEFQQMYQRENNLNNFFREDEIQKLENINDHCIKTLITNASFFSENNIKIVSYSMKVELYNQNYIKNFRFINLIETSYDNHQAFMMFSSNFLPVMINILFGGNSNSIEKTKNTEDVTSTEFFVNKKIVKLVTDCLSQTYKKFFSSKIKFIHTEVLQDLKRFNVHPSKFFLITYFHLKFNNIKIFFSISIPVSTIKNLNKKIVISKNQKKNIHIEQNIENTFSLQKIYNIEFEITVKIIDFSIASDQFKKLSVGSIISISKPDKIIAFIEDKPIFFSRCKIFNEKYIIFIKEFINEKGKTLMSDIKTSSDNELLINSEKKTSKYKNASSEPAYNVDNKKILLDTAINVTVELGRSKIKIKDFLGFSIGSMLVLDKLKKEPLDIFINGHLMASGEIVFLENKYGLRITRINDVPKKI